MISHEYMYFFTGCIYLEITMKATQVVKIGLINKSKNKNDTIQNFAPYKRADATLYVLLIPVSVLVSSVCMSHHHTHMSHHLSLLPLSLVSVFVSSVCAYYLTDHIANINSE